jgi:hypothetical protein
MNTTLKITRNNGYVQATVTGRLTSAIEMLEMENLLHTEQETSTTYSSMLSELHSLMEEQRIHFSENMQYFKGHTDVIFEYSIIMQEMTDPHPKNEIASEHIAGTLFSTLFKHFGWTDWRAPVLAGQEYDTRDFKALIALKR